MEQAFNAGRLRLYSIRIDLEKSTALSRGRRFDETQAMHGLFNEHLYAVAKM